MQRWDWNDEHTLRDVRALKRLDETSHDLDASSESSSDPYVDRFGNKRMSEFDLEQPEKHWRSRIYIRKNENAKRHIRALKREKERSVRNPHHTFTNTQSSAILVPDENRKPRHKIERTGHTNHKRKV
jgi:hypothetical protein